MPLNTSSGRSNKALIAETDHVRKIGVASQALLMNLTSGGHTSVAHDENGDPTLVSVAAPGGTGVSKGSGSGGEAIGGGPQK